MQPPPGFPLTHYITHKRDQPLIFLHLVPLSPVLPPPLPPLRASSPPSSPESPEDELGVGEEDRAFNDAFPHAVRQAMVEQGM